MPLHRVVLTSTAYSITGNSCLVSSNDKWNNLNYEALRKMTWGERSPRYWVKPKYRPARLKWFCTVRGMDLCHRSFIVPAIQTFPPTLALIPIHTVQWY